MAYADEIDPTASVLAYYATKLRTARETAGMSQRDLAKKALISPSLLNKVEAAKRLPSLELSRVADGEFGTGDQFESLFPLVIKHAYPPWFRPYVELEAAARIVRAFESQVVSGLLQTEDYNRAMLKGARLDADAVEDRLALRRQRQLILTKPKPPELWIMLDENVLRRQVGGPDVMRAQLERLLAAAETPTTVIQVVPYSAGSHAGVDGPFTVLTLDEGPDVVAVEGFQHGALLAETEQVRAAYRAYDLLTAVALSPKASIDLIAATAKELA